MLWVKSLIETIITIILNLPDRLFCMLVDWVCWFVNWLLDLLFEFLFFIIDFVPEGLAVNWGNYLAFIPAVNSWFPLDAAAVALAAYMTHQFGFLVYKQILKLIPTVG
jgi:hypothetical protein